MGSSPQSWFELNDPDRQKAAASWFAENDPEQAPPPAEVAPPPRGIVGRIWDFLNKPIISGETVGKFPSMGAAKREERMPPGVGNVNEEIAEWEKRRDIAKYSGNFEEMKRYDQLAANLKGLRDTVAGFTSPIAVGAIGAAPVLRAFKAAPALQTAAGFVPSAAFTATGVEEATRPQEPGETEADVLQRRLSGAGTAAMGAAGLKATTPAAARLTEAGLRKGFKMAEARLAEGPAKAAFEGYKQIVNALPGGRKPDFTTHIERLAGRGHMREFATEYKPETVRAGTEALRSYMNDWETSTIDPAIARHPELTLSGDKMARAILELRNPALDQYFPENAAAVKDVAARFKGKDVPLAAGKDLLAKLNAMTETLQKATPEDQAAIARTNAARAALDKVTDSVREQLYGELDKAGEPRMGEVRKDYGSMKELLTVMRRNIPRAEAAEAGKPKYGSAFVKGYTKHPLLAPGLAAGVGTGAIPAASLIVPPAIEAVRIYQQRAATPNARFKASMDAFAGGPERPPIPIPEPRTTISSEVLPREPAALPPAPEGTPAPVKPIVTPPPPPEADTSYVRGVKGYWEQVPSRQLTVGEGIGPIILPPSPLAPAVGSEPTPTGGRRGYPSAPQPPEAVLPSAKLELIPATSQLIRNPKTGRFEKGWMSGEPTTEARFEKVAKSAGVKFDGFWMDGDVALTDPMTGSSLKIPPEQMSVGAVKSKLAAVRAKFKEIK